MPDRSNYQLSVDSGQFSVNLRARIMKRLLAFLSPLCHSHLIGLIFALSAFVTVTDLAAVVAIIPGQLGFRRQAELLAATPILCVLGCLVVFILSPVGNHSQYAPIRGIGKIPVLGRYFVFVAMVCVAEVLGSLSLNMLTSSSIESLRLSGDIPFESWTRIHQDVGDGVAFRGSGRETRVFFLKEKREAVRRALQKENITAAELGQ